jgi:hypothetical protein
MKGTRLIALAVSAFVVATLALLFLALRAHAAPPVAPARTGATCTVTTTVDGGAGSLRGCLSALTAGETITFSASVFPPGNPQTITLVAALPGHMPADLVVNGVDDVTIDGRGGVILDGREALIHHGVLVVDNAGGVVIKGLWVRGGYAKASIELGTDAHDCVIGGSNGSPGGACSGDCNLINADLGVGLAIGGRHNRVSGNYIGVNAAGSVAAPLQGTALTVQDGTDNVIGGDTPAERNVIRHSIGIYGNAISNTISGNYIGLNSAGTAVLSSSVMDGIVIEEGPHDNVIGGTHPGEANVISGNNEGVIVFEAGGPNRIVGNLIGLDASGTVKVGNASSGVYIEAATGTVVGGLGAGERNVISGNGGDGVRLWGAGAMSNTISGNFIGTNISGSAAIPNTSAGVRIELGAPGNVIGPGNVIADNTGDGVVVDGAATLRNTITRNSIFGNRSGIADINGGNVELFPPIMLNVGAHAVDGLAPPNGTVEVFSDAGNQGRYYQGAVVADGNGHFSYSQATPFTGTKITGTATDADGNTSGFATASSALVDVRPVTILEPKVNGLQLVAVTPLVQILNAGSALASGVQVTVQATGFALSAPYAPPAQTVDVPSLATATLSFPSFAPANAGAYTFIVTVSAPGDENPGNDTLTRAVTVGPTVVDLWIRDNPDDTGTVPTTNWWRSPDLWMRRAPDGGTTFQDPLADHPIYVYAIVRNRGTRASDGGDTLKVECRYLYPGLFDPGAYPGLGPDVSRSVTIPAIPPGGAQTVMLSWNSPGFGPVYLKAQIESNDDPTDWWCPSTVCFCLSATNNNVAALDHYYYDSWAWWPDRLGEGTVRTVVKDVPLRVFNDRSVPRPVNLRLDVSSSPSTTVSLDLGSPLGRRWTTVGGPAKSSGIAWSGGSVVSATYPAVGTIASIPMDAYETQTVTMRLNGPHALSGTVSVYSAIDGTGGDAIVGGYTFVLANPTGTRVRVYEPIVLKQQK